MADPGVRQGCAPLSCSKLFIFIKFYAKNLQNNRLAHPSGVGTPFWEILDGVHEDDWQAELAITLNNVSAIDFTTLCH